MNLCRIAVVLLTLVWCVSCELKAERIGGSKSPDVSVVLKPIEASLTEPTVAISAEETRIVPKGDLANSFESAQFVSTQCGWASTLKSLYRTTNAGTSWEQLPIQLPEDSHVASFFFTDESHGWMVLGKQIFTERYGLGNASKILITTDGGKTWSEQANFPDEVKIYEIKFINAAQGFAVGGRMVDQPVNQGSPYEEIFVLTTDNAGKTWNNNSDAVKTAIRAEGGAVGDSGRSIHSKSQAQTFLLTREGRIIATADKGQTWKTSSRLKDERPEGWVSSTGYYKLISDTEQQLRVIAGAMGDEGYWGDLIVNDHANSWTSYELKRTPILDAVFLSTNEVLACGMELRLQSDKRTPPMVGVILQSLDRGKSWTPIYRSKIKEQFISLTRISENEFYAVSDVGTFLKFTLPQ